MSHKFKLGQLVKRTHPSFADEKAGLSVICEIVRLMPADQAGDVSYRIRAGLAERAVREDEIIAAP